MKNLFVGNMSFNTTEGELRSIFETYGEITSINIITDRDTRLQVCDECRDIPGPKGTTTRLRPHWRSVQRECHTHHETNKR